MKIKVISNGINHSVVDAETGANIEGVIAVEIMLYPDSQAIVRVVLANAKFYTDIDNAQVEITSLFDKKPKDPNENLLHHQDGK